MDKMVCSFLVRISMVIDPRLLYIDPNCPRRSRCYKRWRYDTKTHGCPPSRRKNGVHSTTLSTTFAKHPLQLVDLSAAQDVEAGDGTTSVVVLAGSLLGAAEKMLSKGMHPTIIAESFLKASARAVKFLEEISTPVDLKDKGSLLRAASTSLNSKVGFKLAFLGNY
jgi:TCP-1/cpn60 chaperonin family